MCVGPWYITRCDYSVNTWQALWGRYDRKDQQWGYGVGGGVGGVGVVTDFMARQIQIIDVEIMDCTCK